MKKVIIDDLAKDFKNGLQDFKLVADPLIVEAFNLATCI